MNKTTTIRLPVEMLQALSQLAGAQDRTVSNLIRHLLQQSLKGKQAAR